MARIQIIYKDRIDESKNTIQQAVESAFRYNTDDCGYVVVLDGEWKENVQLYHGVNLYFHNGVTFQGQMTDGGRCLSAVISGNGIVKGFGEQPVFNIQNSSSQLICNCNIVEGNTTSTSADKLSIYTNKGNIVGSSTSTTAGFGNFIFKNDNLFQTSIDNIQIGNYNTFINSNSNLSTTYSSTFTGLFNSQQHNTNYNIFNGGFHSISSSRHNIFTGFGHSSSASHLNNVSGTGNVLLNLSNANIVGGYLNRLNASSWGVVGGSFNQITNSTWFNCFGYNIASTGDRVSLFGSDFSNSDSDVFVVQFGTAKPNLIVSSVGLTGSRIFAQAGPQSTLEMATKGYVDTVAASGATGVTSWGAIIGSISAQTDLQAELDDKPNLNTANTYTSGTQTFQNNLLCAGTTFLQTPTTYGSGLTAYPASNWLIRKSFADTEYTLTGSLVTASSNLSSYINNQVSLRVDKYGDTMFNWLTFIPDGSFNPMRPDLAPVASGVAVCYQYTENRYSTTAHNHALANLSEKSYDSLTNKPDLSVTGVVFKDNTNFNSLTANPGSLEQRLSGTILVKSLSSRTVNITATPLLSPYSGSPTLPANFLKNGKVIRLNFCGHQEFSSAGVNSFWSVNANSTELFAFENVESTSIWSCNINLYYTGTHFHVLGPITFYDNDTVAVRYIDNLVSFSSSTACTFEIYGSDEYSGSEGISLDGGTIEVLN